MLTGPDWLFLEGLSSARYRELARQIYRAFIRISRKYGHVLDLDREESRRQIMEGFRHGRVAKCTVPCVRCGTVAWLGDWLKASEMSTGQAATILDNNPERARAHLLDFLVFCPGGAYKQITYEGTQPPEVL